MKYDISKRLIRHTLLQYRKLLSFSEYHQRNESLVSLLWDLLLELEKKTVHVFLAIKGNKEPDISIIQDKLWNAGFTTVTSITDFKQKTMTHCVFDKQTQTVLNHLGIPEPVNAKEVDPSVLEVILVPLLLSDQQKNRIGYGGGYYDRLLNETKAVKVGLSLTNPVEKIIQSDEWDVPLDYLVTPNKIF